MAGYKYHVVSLNPITMTLYNEIGISLVKWGSWIGTSNEIEYEDGTEIRNYGWKTPVNERLREVYLRIWLWKIVFILSTKNAFNLRKKWKWGLKLIVGFMFSA